MVLSVLIQHSRVVHVFAQVKQIFKYACKIMIVLDLDKFYVLKSLEMTTTCTTVKRCHLTVGLVPFKGTYH